MLYTAKDIKLLKDEIEFIDTAVIPLVSIDMTQQAPVNSNNIELMQMVTMQIEKQFKGRLLITPLVTTINHRTDVALQYSEQLLEYGFKKIIILTHLKTELEEHDVIRLNEIPLENMTADMVNELVGDEVKKVMKSIISIWNR
ncbi:DUF2487 family protein [Corticicoccus populi]|uniref:DUF2487 family protein n=1 Tax=Corticicoccus populi TaxID=1812821 RepID=A0ABW5WVE1_9STAP